MKKIALFLAVFCAAILFSGCSSVQVADKFNGLPLEDTATVPRAHVNVSITGLYFLGVFPLITGSSVNSGNCVGFKDTVNAQNAVYMLTRSSRALGGVKMCNLVTQTDSFCGLLFSTKQINVSATIIGAAK